MPQMAPMNWFMLFAMSSLLTLISIQKLSIMK